jgi:selenocysteine-specific elongation factor
MQVIATAGHVDHGKSTLLRALTGMDPDRWAEEKRRGMTIDLGFAWLKLPSGERIAFVDVPGHERFVPNMLAGVGPVPAVLFVVAADEGWKPQSAEHLAVVDALGIRSGLLVITKSDLADPAPALAQATAQIARTRLGVVPAVTVSAVTGDGLAEMVAALDQLTQSLPVPDPGDAVRLWVDRAFTMTGSGTVVTGTLPAGTVHRGDELVVTPACRPVRVRDIQTLGESAPAATGVARVALNLRGVAKENLARGMAIVQAGRWTTTDLVDIRIYGQDPASPGLASPGVASPGVASTDLAGPGTADGDAASPGQPAAEPPAAELPAGDPGAGPDLAARLPRTVTLHIGSARTVARVRPLAGDIARLSLRDALPMHVGDAVLLRDPGAAGAAGPGAGHAPGTGPDGMSNAGAGWPGVLGAVVLDVAPPPLTRRGAAAAAARELATWPSQPGAAELLRRHGLLRASALLAMGVREHPDPVTGEWLADPGRWAALAAELGEVLAAHAAREPLAAGLPVEAARAALGLPDRRLVTALARPPFRVSAGLVQLMPSAGGVAPGLPDSVAAAVRILRADLAQAPFAAPDAERLRKLGLDVRAVAAAERAGLLLRISDQIVLAPGADEAAACILAALPQPFTAADARLALSTTRRTAIPLLEFLDRAGVTERLPDDRRQVRPRPEPAEAGLPDAGLPDAGLPDAGLADAGLADAEPAEADPEPADPEPAEAGPAEG